MGCDRSAVTHRQAKTEVGRQAVLDLLPGGGTVVAAIYTVVVLQEVGVLLLGMTGDLVNALAEFRILVRHEISFHAGVRDLPFLPAVRRLINAAGGDRDLDVAGIFLIGDDRVQA